MKILSLDVATKTGWCTETAYGLWNLARKRDDSQGARLIRFRSLLQKMVGTDGIDLVVFERSQGKHQAAVIIQSELHGALKVFCEDNSIQYMAFSPSEIKKFATGKGNAGKPAMIQAAKEKFGYNGSDDNEADAICCYHYAKSFNY